MTNRLKLFSGLLGGALLAVVATAQFSMAADSPADLRQDGMKSMNKSLKNLRKLIGTNADKGQIATEAQNIVSISAQIPGWFPKDAGTGESAKPDIWDHWDQFEADAKNLNDQATKLMGAAKQDQVYSKLQEQYEEIGKACGTCHDSFRKE